MPLEIVRNDITKIKVDAIVNSANPHAYIGDGVDSAIHRAAGPELLESRKAIGDIAVGSAVATAAFNLKSKYVIHTVGPIWQGGTENEFDLAKQCYKNSLRVALDKGCTSIAFPLISTGAYGFPKPKALQIAISAISDFLLANDMKVILVVYDRTSYSLSEKLVAEVAEFIDDNYIDEHQEYYGSRKIRSIYDVCENEEFEPIVELDQLYESTPVESKRSLSNLLAELDESFSESLLRMIDEKGKTDVEVYKKANVDRKLFSKIRGNKYYRPSKMTAIAFAVALELNLDETKDLIGRAGFALTHSSKFDVIIEYFIEQENYNVYEINEVLFEFDQVLLGV